MKGKQESESPLMAPWSIRLTINPTVSMSIKLQQGGTVKTGVIGVERAHFPLRCKAEGRTEMGPRSLCRRLGKWEEGVVTRLCDSKLFTGTASSGQPPTMVDLEAGAGVSWDRFLGDLAFNQGNLINTHTHSTDPP